MQFLQAKRLRQSLNACRLPIENDPKGLCKDVSGIGRWGNGDVEIDLSSLDDLPVRDRTRSAIPRAATRWHERQRKTQLRLEPTTFSGTPERQHLLLLPLHGRSGMSSAIPIAIGGIQFRIDPFVSVVAFGREMPIGRGSSRTRPPTNPCQRPGPEANPA